VDTTKILGSTTIADTDEPVSSTDLRSGETYFVVSYEDSALCVPNVRSVVFLGRDLLAHAPGAYFQDYMSWLTGVKFGVPDSGSGDFEVMSDAQLSTTVFSYRHAVDALLRCLVRRRHS
jgi:hypothetical protein